MQDKRRDIRGVVLIILGLLVILSFFGFTDSGKKLLSGFAVFGESVDINAPSVIIESPPNGQKASASHITVKGTASDNKDIDNIKIKVNDGNWIITSGTEIWSSEINLAQGENVIYVQAFDVSGLVSPVSTVSVMN